MENESTDFIISDRTGNTLILTRIPYFSIVKRGLYESVTQSVRENKAPSS